MPFMAQIKKKKKKKKVPSLFLLEVMDSIFKIEDRPVSNSPIH